MNSCMYVIHCGHIHSFIFFSLPLPHQYSPHLFPSSSNPPSCLLFCICTVTTSLLNQWHECGATEDNSLLSPSALPLVALGKVIEWFWIQSHADPMQETAATVKNMSAMAISWTEIRILQTSSPLFVILFVYLFVWPFLILSFTMFSELCRGFYGTRLIIQQPLAISTLVRFDFLWWTLGIIEISLIRVDASTSVDKNIKIWEAVWQHIHLAKQNHLQLLLKLALTSMLLPINS